MSPASLDVEIYGSLCEQQCVNHMSSHFCKAQVLVFESPVWSSFLMPKGFNRNLNRSAFFLEVKKPDRTAKNCGLRSFCGP